MKRNGRRVSMVFGASAILVVGLATWLSWPRISFWYSFAPLGVNVQGYPEYRHRQTGIVFVRLPGGTFLMGAQKVNPYWANYDPDSREEEGPVHEVTLSPFLIAKYEVSAYQWKSVMGSIPSGFESDDELPVQGVSWHDIQAFAVQTELGLPSEAQWEYACRAGTSTPHAGDLAMLGWFSENSGATIHPPGKKTPNGFGIHDMYGNNAEWCKDLFDRTFYSKPEAAGTDPECSSRGDPVIRGGNSIAGAEFCRSSYRRDLSPGCHGGGMGFRPAVPLPR